MSHIMKDPRYCNHIDYSQRHNPSNWKTNGNAHDMVLHIFLRNICSITVDHTLYVDSPGIILVLPYFELLLSYHFDATIWKWTSYSPTLSAFYRSCAYIVLHCSGRYHMRYMLGPYAWSNPWSSYIPHHRVLHFLLQSCILSLVWSSRIDTHICRF